MTSNFVQRGTEIIRSAVEKDNAHDYDGALNLYSRGIEFLITGMKYEQNPRVIAVIKEKVNKYLQRAEDIKIILDSNKNKNQKSSNNKSSNNNKNGGGNNNGNNNGNDNSDNKETDEDKAKLQSALSNAIIMEKPNVKWEDVAGLETTKKLLQEAVILPVKFPHLFTGKLRPCQGILLYGPPGTGKSYLAKAVATEAIDSTFFSVSSADLVSKYVGDSEKLVKELFTMARDKKPSIVFIDEIDSLASKRSDNEQSSSRRMKTEFLVQMEGVGKLQNGVLTLGATNCPWDLDPAIRRRFTKRIYIPLPDKATRKSLFEIHIGNTNNKLDNNDFEILADKTDGFSGSDISSVVQDALMEPVRTIQSATYFKKVFNNRNDNNGSDSNNNGSNNGDDSKKDDFILVACSPNDPNGQKMTLMQIPTNDQQYVRTEALRLTHFLRVLDRCKPSVGQEDIGRYLEWTKEYGQEG